MKDIIISKNPNGIIKSQEIYKALKSVESRLYESEQRATNLLENLNNSKGDIQKVVSGEEGKPWWLLGTIDKEKLLDLIRKENNAVSKTISNISKLLVNSNRNTRTQSEMIRGLTILSTMSYTQLNESVREIKVLKKQQSENVNAGYERDNNIDEITNFLLEKKKDEYDWKNYVESNLDSLNNRPGGNINKSEEKLNFKISEINRKINKIENSLSRRSEKKSVNTLKNQKEKINLMTMICITNIIIILGLILYIMKYL
ncbi:hypothetical protein [Formosa haliotis]|uniref:hypothetical protein n=1 Tax=Formosa haliotis TaxID=1555194 RepID=UPI000826F0E6|nr:hypothetical protein [Formosa haliotis]